jgi:hypothetical protein
MSNPVLSMDALRKLPQPPRLHPNGFIQLEIVEGLRFHVWPEKPIRVREPATPLHDHVFDLESTVLLGGLIDVAYEIDEHPEGDYEVCGVTCFASVRRDAALEPTDGRRYKLRYVRARFIGRGQTYAIPAFAFHDSRPQGLTASLMRMTRFRKDRSARVLCLPGKRETEPFRRDCSPEELDRAWSEIERASALIP